MRKLRRVKTIRDVKRYLKGRLAMTSNWMDLRSTHHRYSDSGRIQILKAISVLALSLLSSVAFAQDKAQGMIKARNGSTIVLQTTAEQYLNVILEDTTTVAQNEGVFKARKKSM